MLFSRTSNDITTSERIHCLFCLKSRLRYLCTLREHSFIISPSRITSFRGVRHTYHRNIYQYLINFRRGNEILNWKIVRVTIPPSSSRSARRCAPKWTNSASGSRRRSARRAETRRRTPRDSCAYTRSQEYSPALSYSCFSTIAHDFLFESPLFESPPFPAYQQETETKVLILV